MRDRLVYTGDFLTNLIKKDPKEKYDWLITGCQRAAIAVCQTLRRIQEDFPEQELLEEEPFQWSGLYERAPVYIQILQDLITKLMTGYYPLEQYLPHEEELALEYGVALTTGPLARRTAPQFTADDLAVLKVQLEKSDTIPLTALVNAISLNLDLEPLCSIFQETEHLVR